MASTIKVDTITTPDGTGNISVDRPLSGSGAGLTSLPAANLTGALPAISGASLTDVGGGAWNLISSTNITSTTASVDFTTGINATYRTYAVIWEGVVSNTNIDSITAVLGDSSGFDTGSGDYKYTATYTYNSSAGSAQGSASSNLIDFSGMYSGTASGSSVFGQATFTRPIDSASFPSVRWSGGCYSHSSEARETTGVGVRTAAITVDRIKFAFYTGSIIRGRFTLYGIAHA